MKRKNKMNDIIYIVCAWCKKDMGTKSANGSSVGKTSHSICPECSEKLMREVMKNFNEN